MKKLIVYFIILCMILFTGCKETNNNIQENTVDFNVGEKNILDEKPIKILLHSRYKNFGIPYYVAGLTGELFYQNLFNKISELCIEKFGYSVEFITYPQDKTENEYAAAFQAGLDYDLIFPTRVCDYGQLGNFKPLGYWNEDFFDMYMDLSPYLGAYCPDVYNHMKSLDYIMDMVTRRGKILALYAGIPDISHTTLMVRNNIVNRYNVQGIGNYDELYELMETMNAQEGIHEQNRILIDDRTLLGETTIRAGYYAGYNLFYDKQSIICKLDDENFKPLLIEDTNLLDYFFDEFARFFDQSYFMHQERGMGYDPLFSEKGPGMFLSNDVFITANYLFEYDDYPKEIPWNNYTMFVFDDSVPVIRSIDSIQLILVSSTCTQPEKALSFVNWLFTDEKIADLLTFGVTGGQYTNYLFTPEGNLYYKKDNKQHPSVYRFHNLIANFSDRFFPFENTSLDQSEQILRMAPKAIYPPLYCYLESTHSDRYNTYSSLNMAFGTHQIMEKRSDYIYNSIIKLFDDPMATTAEKMKRDLDEMTDKDKLLDFCYEHISKLTN